MPENRPDEVITDTTIKRVDNVDDFKIWAEISNQVFADGYQDIHPVNHYHWVEKDLLIPYIAYSDDKTVAVTSVLNNNGVAALEFMATLPDYRR